MDEKGLTADTNPYELNRDHPAAQELQLSMKAIQTFVTGKDVDPTTSGEYLKRIWERCLLRRTYSSVDPSFGSNVSGERRRIGESLPLLFTRRIICRFTETEQKTYDELSREPLQKLAKFLPGGRVDMLKFIHTKQGSTLTFALPGRDEIAKQLAVICQGSPKLRQLLQMIASLVVLSDKKIGIWSSTPANQLLLCACFRALRIDAAIYTSELNPEERKDLVKRFTTEVDKCHIFVGSYSVGSIGLNLQALCNHSVDFDSPSNEGQSKQSIGRFRRISQPFNVERFELKAILGATAELAVAMTGTIDKGEIIYNISSWYRIGDELIEAPDLRVDHLPVEQRLTAKELVEAILDIRRGRQEEALTNKRWVTEAVASDIPRDASLE
ncbi:hypothetical protein VE02_02227 [Pseudogymnoascus sp. 03VT05]|nr:hypothetical protein VE02_02227 [Pseudogymnoascus sp. 03VT05]